MNNRELDAKMAALMGWIYCDFDFRDYDGEYPMYIVLDALLIVYDEANKHREFSPSTDIAAAWLVVEKMRERGISITIVPQKDDYLVTASDFQPTGNYYRYLLSLTADSFEKLPEAICRAALKVVEADK